MPSNSRGIARSTPSSTAVRAHAGAVESAATASTRPRREVSFAFNAPTVAAITAFFTATPPAFASRTIASTKSASRLASPLTTASTRYGCSPAAISRARSAASAAGVFASPKDNANCRRTAGSDRTASDTNFATISASNVGLSNFSATRIAAAHTRASWSASAASTVTLSSPPTPSNVQSACTRANGVAAATAIFLKLTTAAGSRFSTSKRCAVSRTQPFASPSFSTNCAVVAVARPDFKFTLGAPSGTIRQIRPRPIPSASFRSSICLRRKLVT